MASSTPPPTQAQHLHMATRSIAERDLVFLHMMRTNPITHLEFQKLLAKRPEVWDRYRAFFGS